MTVRFWLWLTLVGMARGAAAIFFVAERRTADEETDGILHGIVPMIAATSYFAMACGQAVVRIPPTGDVTAQYEFYYARYVD